jgi:Tfp pilus assembly protein FimT
VSAVLVLLAAPSFQDMILMQRLRGTNAQLVTDLQLARSEAVARGRHARLYFNADSAQTCYTIYVADGDGLARCDCTRGAGAACTATGTTEVKTVSLPRSNGVLVQVATGQSPAFAFSYITGGLLTNPTDVAAQPLAQVQINTLIDDDRRLTNTVGQSGRPTVCAPNSSRMGVVACP